MERKSEPDPARITWLASYPKSGNTWTRIFITSYLGETPEEADINDLYGGPIASSRVMFAMSTGIDAACLLPEEIESLRPAVYRHVAGVAQRDLFFKVHDAWKHTHEGEPLFPIQVTRGTVYIVRNPLDVAVSAAHHYGQSSEMTVEQLCQRTFTLAKFKPGAPASQLPQHVGSWSDHVCSWLRHSALSTHVMRYEDMVADPAREFRRMLQYLQIAVDEQRLQQAIVASSFEKLQRQESEKGFRERRGVATAPFFRRGIAGSWREELPPHLAQRLIDEHGTMMRELGYLDGHEQPVF